MFPNVSFTVSKPTQTRTEVEVPSTFVESQEPASKSFFSQTFGRVLGTGEIVVSQEEVVSVGNSDAEAPSSRFNDLTNTQKGGLLAAIGTSVLALAGGAGTLALANKDSIYHNTKSAYTAVSSAATEHFSEAMTAASKYGTLAASTIASNPNTSMYTAAGAVIGLGGAAAAAHYFLNNSKVDVNGDTEVQKSTVVQETVEKVAVPAK